MKTRVFQVLTLCFFCTNLCLANACNGKDSSDSCSIKDASEVAIESPSSDFCDADAHEKAVEDIKRRNEEKLHRAVGTSDFLGGLLLIEPLESEVVDGCTTPPDRPKESK